MGEFCVLSTVFVRTKSALNALLATTKSYIVSSVPACGCGLFEMSKQNFPRVKSVLTVQQILPSSRPRLVQVLQALHQQELPDQCNSRCLQCSKLQGHHPELRHTDLARRYRCFRSICRFERSFRG